MNSTETMKWILANLINDIKDTANQGWRSSDERIRLSCKIEGIELALDYINGYKDRDAEQIWHLIPSDERESIMLSIFCRRCGVATLKEYTVIQTDGGIKLGGNCAICSNFVEKSIKLEKTQRERYEEYLRCKAKHEKQPPSSIDDICA